MGSFGIFLGRPLHLPNCIPDKIGVRDDNSVEAGLFSVDIGVNVWGVVDCWDQLDTGVEAGE